MPLQHTLAQGTLHRPWRGRGVESLLEVGGALVLGLLRNGGSVSKK
jgi:hypothetical protein